MNMLSNLNLTRKTIMVAFSSLILLGLVALVVVNASLPGRSVEGCPDGCSSTAETSDVSLKVVSLNMLHGIPLFRDLELRVSLIAGEIKRLDADVAILQEVPWTIKTGNVAEVLGKQLGYNYLYVRANGNKHLITFEEGEAILSRYPLKDVIFTELRPRVDLFQHRMVLGATAVTPWGEIRFFGTHLTHSNPGINVKQLSALRNFVETNTQGMAIVGGDFNAKADSAQIRGLEGEWTDTYHRMHPGDAGLTCCMYNLNAPPGETLQMRIDYIFLVNERGELTSAEHAFYAPFKVGEGWQWASDHTGLIIELKP
jgi:endonuclease/exonuclease/phosphatase family metal-dependent hydrolase